MHIEILTAIAAAYPFPRYLEIGVGDGGCFERVAAECEFTVAVDVPENPYTNSRIRTIAANSPDCEFYYHGSDEFFEQWEGDNFDLIFIDGSHLYEQVSRDFWNATKVLAPLGTIALHDTWAPTAEDAHNGSDTAWILADYLENRTDYQAFTLPIFPGLTLVRPNLPRSYS